MISANLSSFYHALGLVVAYDDYFSTIFPVVFLSSQSFLLWGNIPGQEKIKVREWIPHKGLLPKLLSYF